MYINSQRLNDYLVLLLFAFMNSNAFFEIHVLVKNRNERNSLCFYSYFSFIQAYFQKVSIFVFFQSRANLKASLLLFCIQALQIFTSIVLGT